MRPHFDRIVDMTVLSELPSVMQACIGRWLPQAERMRGFTLCRALHRAWSNPVAWNSLAVTITYPCTPEDESNYVKAVRLVKTGNIRSLEINNADILGWPGQFEVFASAMQFVSSNVHELVLRCTEGSFRNLEVSLQLLASIFTHVRVLRIYSMIRFTSSSCDLFVCEWLLPWANTLEVFEFVHTAYKQNFVFTPRTPMRHLKTFAFTAPSCSECQADQGISFEAWLPQVEHFAVRLDDDYEWPCRLTLTSLPELTRIEAPLCRALVRRLPTHVTDLTLTYIEPFSGSAPWIVSKIRCPGVQRLKVESSEGSAVLPPSFMNDLFPNVHEISLPFDSDERHQAAVLEQLLQTRSWHQNLQVMKWTFPDIPPSQTFHVMYNILLSFARHPGLFCELRELDFQVRKMDATKMMLEQFMLYSNAFPKLMCIRIHNLDIMPLNICRIECPNTLFLDKPSEKPGSKDVEMSL